MKRAVPHTRILIAGSLFIMLLTGCAHVPNYYRETGPSVDMAWDSPTAMDIKERFEPAQIQPRDWTRSTVAPKSGAIHHWPLYFEDPFEDKSHGRTTATHGHNVYHLGWEDWVALPYGLSRFTANWLMLPVSAVVTPPWTVMVSDGEISRQLVFRDHDATPVHQAEQAPAPEPPIEEQEAENEVETEVAAHGSPTS